MPIDDIQKEYEKYNIILYSETYGTYYPKHFKEKDVIEIFGYDFILLIREEYMYELADRNNEQLCDDFTDVIRKSLHRKNDYKWIQV